MELSSGWDKLTMLKNGVQYWWGKRPGKIIKQCEGEIKHEKNEEIIIIKQLKLSV